MQLVKLPVLITSITPAEFHPHCGSYISTKYFGLLATSVHIANVLLDQSPLFVLTGLGFFFPLSTGICLFLFSYSGVCHYDMVFEKSRCCWRMCRLSNWAVWRWHGMLCLPPLRMIVVVLGCRRKWVKGVLLRLLLLLLHSSAFLCLSSLTIFPQLISSSDSSMEHLALRRTRGWGPGTFDEWKHIWLTPLLSDFLILTVSISFLISHLLTLSEPLSLFILASAPHSRQWLLN